MNYIFITLITLITIITLFVIYLKENSDKKKELFRGKSFFFCSSRPAFAGLGPAWLARPGAEAVVAGSAPVSGLVPVAGLAPLQNKHGPEK